MVASVPSSYDDPRAHALWERYLRSWGGEEIPVPVESIAEDLLGLRLVSAVCWFVELAEAR